MRRMADTPGPFRCELQPLPGSVQISVHGELDMATAPELVSMLAGVYSADLREIVLDLRRLTFVDSTGLRCFLDARRSTHERGIELALIAGPPSVQRVFELAGVAHALDFRDA